MSTDGDEPAEPRARDAGGVIREVSYGGLVVRETDAGAEMLAIVPRGKAALALPKGGADAAETGEQTALREVREETGIEATVRAPLGDVKYWYRRGGRRVFKTVHFYLCDHVGGEARAQESEVAEVRWVPLEQAPRALSYRGERGIAERALALVARGDADR